MKKWIAAFSVTTILASATFARADDVVDLVDGRRVFEAASTTPLGSP